MIATSNSDEDETEKVMSAPQTAALFAGGTKGEFKDLFIDMHYFFPQ